MSIENIHTYNISWFDAIGDSTNFKITLDIQNELIGYLTHVSLTNSVIPKSFYLINKYNDTFALYENTNQPYNATTIINIPHGNYNFTQLINKLSLLCTTQSATNLNNFTYTFSDELPQNNTSYDTMKIKVSITLNPMIVLFAASININLNSSLTDIVGSTYTEPNGINPFIVGAFPNNIVGQLIFPNVFNLNPDSQLYIVSSLVSSTYNDYKFSNVLGVWYIQNTDAGAFINSTYDLIANKKRFNSIWKTYTIQILNQRGFEIDLNGLDIA